MRTRHLVLLLIAFSVISISAFSRHHVALYDGVGMPDEPYRYVTPPSAALKTASPPTAATQEFVMKDGRNKDTLIFSTQELGPQLLIGMGKNSLLASKDVTQLSVHATPVTASGTMPKDGTLTGNVYTVTVTPAARYIRNASEPSYLDIRLPQGYPRDSSTVEYRKTATDAWIDTGTIRVGNDIYEGPFVGFGDYALVISTIKPGMTTKPAVKHRSGLVYAVPIWIIGIIGTILLIRYQNTKGTHARRQKPRA